MERFEVFNDNQLVKEEFKKNDSIISNYYLQNNQKILEIIIQNGKTIYENNCRYDEDGKNLYICSIRDETKGEELFYDGERMTFKSLWKNLPKGTAEIKERYNADGTSTKTTVFSNGDLTKKTIREDGSYTIETASKKENSVKEYTKNGKLVKKYSPDYKAVDE